MRARRSKARAGDRRGPGGHLLRRLSAGPRRSIDGFRVELRHAGGRGGAGGNSSGALEMDTSMEQPPAPSGRSAASMCSRRTTCRSRRAARAFSRRRRVRGQPGVEPGRRQDGVPGKDADRAAPAHRVAALVGDLATENDAARLARSKAPVKQITTGTVCHLEAEMVDRAVEDWNLERSAISCSSRTSATSCARRLTIWARACGWCCCR